MAPDARYLVHAWEAPFVGHDTIRAEFLRQAPGIRDLRIEILTIGSVGQIVLIEATTRSSSMTNPWRPISRACSKWTPGEDRSWRDYFDSREIAVQVGEG